MNSKSANLLLDSHVFIWALEQVEKLGDETKQLLEANGTVYVSTASLWELAIKYVAGKFPYDTRALQQGMQASGFQLLNLTPDHLQAYESVRLAHNDPFDRLLVAQAVNEGCVLVTADQKILDTNYKLLDARQ